MWKKGNNFVIYAMYSLPNNKSDFTSLNVTSKTIMIGDFSAHSPKWGYKDTNAAGKEMEDLNTSVLELIYNDTDPSTYLHFNGAQTTPDLLLVSSDISANTKCIILGNLGSGHKRVIASIPLSRQQRTSDSYIRTSWNFKKTDWGSFTDMLEINQHQERIDFSLHPDKFGKVINSSIINCIKACIPRGRVKRYKCIWTDDLEILENQRENLRKRAEHTGRIEDVQS